MTLLLYVLVTMFIGGVGSYMGVMMGFHHACKMFNDTFDNAMMAKIQSAYEEDGNL